MDYSLPGPSVHGIFQASVLEWVAIAFSREQDGEMYLRPALSLGGQATAWEGSPSGSPVPGILQARTLEWAAISFSNA